MKPKHGPVKQLLLSGSFWALSKPLVYTLGLETAFLLCNFAEAENLSSDGWFYQTISTVEQMTTLSRRKQDKAIAKLEKLGILETDIRGMPAKRYFMINYDKVGEILFGDSVQTSMVKTDKLDCSKRTTNKELNNKELNNKHNTLSSTQPEEKDTIIEKWNELGLHQVRTINSGTKRYKSLKARIDEYSLEEVLEAIDNIHNSSFLKGNNNRGWEITFDWFTKPNNFTKVLEGQYKDKEMNNNEKHRQNNGRNEKESVHNKIAKIKYGDSLPMQQM